MEDLLDTDAVAEMLGLKPETVRWYSKHRARRQPPFPEPCRYYGRTPVWDREAIRSWSDGRPSSRRREPSADRPVL